MKIGVIKKILKEDLASKGEVPPWMDELLLVLNQFITTVGTAISGKLTLHDNLATKTISQSFTSGVELKINPLTTAKVVGMIPVYLGGKTLTKWKMVYKSDGTIGITLTFDEGGSSTCTIYLLT